MPRTTVNRTVTTRASRNGKTTGKAAKKMMDDVRAYLHNRTKFPLDVLAKFAGQWIAWSPDGKRIVANATNEALLDSLILQAGHDPSECIVEGIPTVGESTLGGGSFQSQLP